MEPDLILRSLECNRTVDWLVVVDLYRVSQKSNPLIRLLHLFPLAAIVCIQKFTQLFVIYILTCALILVH